MVAISTILVFCLLQVAAKAIQINSFSRCPDNCSSHGKCESINGTNVCVCEEQWGGVNCAYRNFDLESDHALSVTIDHNECYYFTIANDDPPKKNLTILVLGFTRNHKAKGPSFYLAHNYYPNSTHYEFMNDSIALKKNLTILNPKSGTWYLAVLGQDPDPLILTIQANLDDLHYKNYSKYRSQPFGTQHVSNKKYLKESYKRMSFLLAGREYKRKTDQPGLNG